MWYLLGDARVVDTMPGMRGLARAGEEGCCESGWTCRRRGGGGGAGGPLGSWACPGPYASPVSVLVLAAVGAGAGGAVPGAGALPPTAPPARADAGGGAPDADSCLWYRWGVVLRLGEWGGEGARTGGWGCGCSWGCGGPWLGGACGEPSPELDKEDRLVALLTVESAAWKPLGKGGSFALPDRGRAGEAVGASPASEARRAGGALGSGGACWGAGCGGAEMLVGASAMVATASAGTGG